MRRTGHRLAALVVCAALGASACGSATPNALAFEESIDDPSRTQVTVVTSDPASVSQAIESWERSRPTVEVTIDVRTSSDLVQMLLGEDGTTADVIALNPTARAVALDHPELFVDLDETLGEAVLEPLIDDLVEAGRERDGALIGLPYSIDAMALAINTEMLSEVHTEALVAAETWCDLLSAADRFTEGTGSAFFGDPTELARAQFAQSRSAYADDGVLLADDEAELTFIWDTTMLSLGRDVIHGDPCPEHEPIGRVARNFTFGDPLWTNAIAADGFASALLSFRAAEELEAGASATAGSWQLLPLPGQTGASDGLVHLAIPTASEQTDLAVDLVTWLASPPMQERSFLDESPTLPVIERLYEDPAATRRLDEFYGPGAFEPFALAAMSRPSDVDVAPEREVVIDLVLESIRDVANDARSPEEAWDELISRLP